MDFETLSIQAVKSISQRRMLWHWSELAAGRRFPAFSDFHSDGGMIDPKATMIWSVEDECGRRTFRARHHGARLTQAFHDDWVGRTMQEVVPEHVRQYAIDTANECAESGCAVFSILSTVDAAGHRVDCERLLLPFGTDAKVEALIASMQLISLQGNYERSTVLDRYRKTSRIELAGRIPAGFGRPEVSTPGTVIQLERVGLPVAGK